MELINLLNRAEIVFYGETFEVSLGWLGNLIRLLTIGVGSVGVGIILFSLILKAITLPFDVHQRMSMRKQNQKMKENQARMEKLQKQYANDKQAYNQKVMEMYKENGISMFSSCLPMIFSLVIFFVAINAFNAFSRAANIENYNAMANAYNARLESYCADLDVEETSIQLIEKDADNNQEIDSYFIQVKQPEKYIYYEVPVSAEKAASFKDNKDLQKEYVKSVNHSDKAYYVDGDLVSEEKKETDGVKTLLEGKEGEEKNLALVSYIENQAQIAVKEAYEEEGGVADKAKFLWIKNIWATDASYKHPVLGYSDFEAQNGGAGGCGGCSGSTVSFDVNGEEVEYSSIKSYTRIYEESAYNKITGQLDTQKEQANGYYILIVLSIGTILLQQFVTMRSQKEQQKYSSVDGQGGSQQKMTMIIMTGMFAIFSFMYSAAFSIYMIMSNVISLVSTLVINKIVDVRAAKKEAATLQAKYDKRLPRVSTNDKKKKK